jgi:type II restriction enzyme
MIYGIETNFYASSGSKLNETARSYKTLALETKDLKNFKFVWFTDGQGWNSAKNNLQETFDVLDNLYCISDLENNVISNILK